MNDRRTVIRETLAGFLTACGLAVIIAAVCGRGWLQAESGQFIVNYLRTDRSLAAMVFDPLMNDWSYFQSRELNYLLDLYNARLLALCAGYGFLHLQSILTVPIAAATVALMIYYTRSLYPRLPAVTVHIAAQSYLLTGSVCDGGFVFFRTAKPLAALFLVWGVFLFIEQYRDNFRNSGKTAGMGIIMLLASLSDRQGAFFAAGLAGFSALLLGASAIPALAVRCGIRHDLDKKTLLYAVIFFVGIIAAAAVYDLVLAPLIIHACNGYYPSYFCQQVPFAGWSIPLLKAPKFIFANTGFYLTSYPAAAINVITGIIMLTAVTAVFVRKKRSALWAFIICMAAAATASTIMVWRLQPITEYPTIYSNYFSPFLAMFWIFGMQAADAGGKTARTIWRCVTAVSIITYVLFVIIMPPPVTGNCDSALERAQTPVIMRAVKDKSIDIRTVPCSERQRNFIRKMREIYCTGRR